MKTEGPRDQSRGWGATVTSQAVWHPKRLEVAGGSSLYPPGALTLLQMVESEWESGGGRVGQDLTCWVMGPGLQFASWRVRVKVRVRDPSPLRPWKVR